MKVALTGATGYIGSHVLTELHEHGHTAGRSGYLPVSEHGLIGDLHCVALVGTNGTIDWHCGPCFDAPSVFGSLLDADRDADVGKVAVAKAIPAAQGHEHRRRRLGGTRPDSAPRRSPRR